MIKKKFAMPGMTVYHSFFDHLGRGTVQRVREKDGLGYPTTSKILVLWDGAEWCRLEGPNPLWHKCSELRRTPRS